MEKKKKRKARYEIRDTRHEQRKTHDDFVESFKDHDMPLGAPSIEKEELSAKKDKQNFRPQLVIRYIQFLKEHLKNDNLKESPLLLELVSDIAELSYSAREILKIHTDAIDRVTRHLNQVEVRRVVEQSRYLLLGVMIHLVDFYRERR